MLRAGFIILALAIVFALTAGAAVSTAAWVYQRQEAQRQPVSVLIGGTSSSFVANQHWLEQHVYSNS